MIITLLCTFYICPSSECVLTAPSPKQADDELDNPVLAGFEWDKEESWTRLKVHQKKEGAQQSSKKAKKGKGEDD